MTSGRLLPLLVAAYMEKHPGSPQTIKQHLAAIKMLFDYLVISQVYPGSGLVCPMGRDRGLGLFDGLGISQEQRPAARGLGIRLLKPQACGNVGRFPSEYPRPGKS